MQQNTEICLATLNTKQFKTFDQDPTKTIESKIPRALWKMKSKCTDKKLYSTGSVPGRFYSIASYPTITKLPICSIISNINTPSWKRGTSKTLVTRAFNVCPNPYHLNKGLNHLKRVLLRRMDTLCGSLDKLWKMLKITINNFELAAKTPRQVEKENLLILSL